VIFEKIYFAYKAAFLTMILELIDELIILCYSFKILWWILLWFNKI